MIRISHEVPLCLMDDSIKFNDYHYCLPHFLDKFEQYNNFYQNARKKGDFIIMDNGLFEGITHTEQDLLSKINQINPNIFIVPDEWNNDIITYKNAKHWINNYENSLPHLTNLMVVLQGKNYNNIKLLYNQLIDLGYTHFAFNHSSIAYQEIFPNENKLISQMMGRILLINKLMSDGILNKNHYIHLLGCSLPQEFLYYKGNYDFIKSVDTSNPIIMGLKGYTYEPYGVFHKPTEKIEEFMEVDIENKKDIILYNVNIFRKYIYNKLPILENV